MSIGPTVLAQTVESMRRIRNSARFILGNIGDPSQIEKVSKADMGLVRVTFFFVFFARSPLNFQTKGRSLYHARAVHARADCPRWL